jgi:hypothetical protein
VPDPNFFNLQLELNEYNHDCVFRWRAKNIINGLMYGNGGISCWTREFVDKMRTHEASDGSDSTSVEFCFHPKYWAMHDCYSTTYPNSTPFQAWRAGFREGVKMCLDQGRKLELHEFQSRAVGRNHDYLCIWQSVGSDVENGQWAIYGARLGTYMTMIKNWDHRQVQDFDFLKELWIDLSIKGNKVDHSLMMEEVLKNLLGLDILTMTPEYSKFFKKHYKSDWRNLGPMARE